MHSTEKIIIAGESIHHYHYSRHIEYGEEKPKRKGFTKVWLDEASDCPDVADKTDTHAYRVRKAVKLLVESNAFQYRDGNGKYFTPIFVTLTFADAIKTVLEANPMFKNFTKRLNYEIYGLGKAKLRYLVVPEFQPVSGRVHYHVIYFNLPFVDRVYDVFKAVWGNGYVNVKTVFSVQHLTNYVVKYITKDKRDERLAGKKKYFCSRGLLRPQTFREAEVILPFLDKLNVEPEFTGSFTSPLSDLTTDYTLYRTQGSRLEEFRQALLDHFSCNQFAKRLAKAPDVKNFRKVRAVPPPLWQQAPTIPIYQVQQNLFAPNSSLP